MSGTPGGFAHAPVTKALLLASGTASLLTRTWSPGRAPPRMLGGLSGALAFRSPSQLLFGCLLLYQFRLLERQLGSAKYGAYAASVTGLSYLLQLAAGRLLRLPVSPLFPAPLPLALASFVPYALDVPATRELSLLGLSTSEKAFVYLSGLQLLLSVGRRGAVAGALCLVAGVLHRANFLGLRKLRLPGALVRLVSHAFGPLLSDGASGPVVVLPSAARHPGALPGGVGGGGFGVGAPAAAGAAAAAPPPDVEPSPGNIAALVAMGFNEARAAAALRRAGDDVQAAVAQLLA